MDHFQQWIQKTGLTDDPTSAALDFILPQRIPIPYCCSCSAAGPHAQTIPLFEGQVLPPTWEGDWMQAAVCVACYARQQALLHPVTLMAFRHGR